MVPQWTRLWSWYSCLLDRVPRSVQRCWPSQGKSAFFLHFPENNYRGGQVCLRSPCTSPSTSTLVTDPLHLLPLSHIFDTFFLREYSLSKRSPLTPKHLWLTIYRFTAVKMATFIPSELINQLNCGHCGTHNMTGTSTCTNCGKPVATTA